MQNAKCKMSGAAHGNYNIIVYIIASLICIQVTKHGKRMIEKQKELVNLIISDTGIGMSKEYGPHIFEAFSQEDSSSTNKYGSTGLGMPITKSIVELMNGNIEVESEKGKGTTFTVTVTLGESSRKSSGTADSEINPHELSVLVIDDDRIALEHAELVLGQIGICCETAESGWEGIDKVRIRHGRREDYDLILIDWRMPEMDGLEAAAAIKDFAKGDADLITSADVMQNAIDAQNKVLEKNLESPLDCKEIKPVNPKGNQS